MNAVAKKYCFSICILNLFQGLFFSCLKVLVLAGTKDEPLVKTVNSSSVKVQLERSSIMFPLYLEVYVLMDLTGNFWNGDLHLFCEKRTFIDVDVYMRFNRGVDSKVFCSLLM